MIHCYGFSKDKNPTEDILNRIEAILGTPIKNVAKVHEVRDVSPKKLMLCVSFQLPSIVAFSNITKNLAGNNNHNIKNNDNNNINNNIIEGETEKSKEEIETHVEPRSKKAKQS